MLRGVTPPIPACASHPRRLTWIVLMFHIGVFRCWLGTPHNFDRDHDGIGCES